MVEQTNIKLWRDRQAGERAQCLLDIKTSWDYYEGRAPDPLLTKPGQINDNVKINLARPLVEKGISFLFGKEVTWQVDETAAADNDTEQFLKQIWDANDKQLLLHELGQNGALGGIAAIKVDPQPGGQFDLINLDPTELQLFSSPHNINDIWRYRIEYVAEDADGNERHYRQDIVRLGDRGAHWELRDFEAVPGEPYDLVKTTPWAYALPPIVYCKNLPRANCLWGYGDLEDAKLNDSLNLIASTVRKTLRLHAHPRTIHKGGSAPKQLDWGPDKMLQIGPEDDVFNLEMQSDLSAARQFFVDLRQALFATARTPDLSTLGERLGQITNFGLHVLFADLLEKNETKRVLYGGLITRLNRLLCLLAGKGDNVTCTLSWPDPLPEDELGKANETLAKQKTGLVSDETLTAELGYSFADEQKRLKLERAEKAALGMTQPTLPGLSPGVAAAPPREAGFQIGDRVQVRAGAEHGAGMGGAGTVAIVATPALGIKLDAMPDTIHKWYVADELEPESAPAANVGMAGMELATNATNVGPPSRHG